MVAEFSSPNEAQRGSRATFGPAHVYDEFDDQEQSSSTPQTSSGAARNLGILSLVLGTGALFMPALLSRLSGLEQRRRLLPLVGLRELTSGIGLLSTNSPGPWLWSRVIGDGMDLAVLASSLLSPRNPRKLNAAVTTAVVAAITAIDVRESLRSSSRAPSAAPDALVTASVIVGKSARECYDFWRDPTNMTRISPIVESVTVVDNRTSRWCIRSPLGTRIEWDSKVTGDTPGERISWRSVDGGGLYHAGVIRFEQAVGGRGTLVTTSMHYRVPGGSAGVALAKLMGADPRKEVREDLRRFKQLLEAGEIPTTEGQPNGRRSLIGSLS